MGTSETAPTTAGPNIYPACGQQLPLLEPLHVPGRTDRILLGNSLTVEQRTLTPSVLVRIQVPQPHDADREDAGLIAQKP